mgnify:FL=1
MVPRFTNKVAQVIAKNKMEEVAVSFTNLTQEVTVMDEHSLRIMVIIKGQEVSGIIIDGGSRVNVINKLACDRLGIKWETCPFWLRMVDTSIARPLGLIR